MRTMLSWLLFICLLSGLVGCTQPIAGKELKSDKERIDYPDISEIEVENLVDGNNAFALVLYQQLINNSENLFYSPYSLSLALAMTYAGARAETAQQMADTLHFYLSQEVLQFWQIESNPG